MEELEVDVKGPDLCGDNAAERSSVIARGLRHLQQHLTEIGGLPRAPIDQGGPRSFAEEAVHFNVRISSARFPSVGTLSSTSARYGTKASGAAVVHSSSPTTVTPSCRSHLPMLRPHGPAGLDSTLYISFGILLRFSRWLFSMESFTIPCRADCYCSSDLEKV